MTAPPPRGSGSTTWGQSRLQLVLIITRHRSAQHDHRSVAVGAAPVPMKTWVLVYDIADDRLRQRVAKRVLRDGVRVQESVFEVVVRTDAGFQRMQNDLRTLMAGSSDAQIRWYGMNLDGYARAGAIGTAPPALPPAVLVA